MKLFEETANYTITVSPEIMEIREFKSLILRYKEKNLAVLSYVFHMADFRSPYQQYDEQERIEQLIRDLDLGARWQPGFTVTAAIDKYRELSETDTTRSLRTVRKALRTSESVVDHFRKQIELALASPEGEEEITSMLKNVQNLITISEKLPKVVENIQRLEETAKKEITSASRIKGGGEVGMFEE